MKVNLTPARIKRLRPRKSEFTIWDADTPHLGIRVIPGGKKSFIHLAKKDGKLKRITVGDASVMPLDKARTIARGLTDGRDWKPKPPPCPLFGEWAVEVWWPQKADKLKPSTRERYWQELNRKLIPKFGDKQLNAVRRSDILPWFERRSRTSPGGANKELQLLRSIFIQAVRMEVIQGNPARNIRFNPKRKVTRFLSADERERLLQEIEAVPQKSRTQALAVKMLLFTGCRLKEITGLRWDEVGDKVLYLADSKTEARKVWLGTEACEILAEARSWRDTSRSPDFVFPHVQESEQCLGRINGFWRRLRTRAGIPDVRIHDLRHSFATEAVRKGVPLPIVSKLLGHSSIQMTMRYTHASNEEVEAAAQQIATTISSLLLQGEKVSNSIIN